MLDRLAVLMSSKIVRMECKSQKYGMMKMHGQRVVAETANMLIVNVELQAMSAKLCG